MTSRSKTTGGFTLIEMIVVIAILGLIMMLVTVNGSPASPAIHARAAAEAISATLRTARSKAVRENRSVEVTIDLALRSYRLDTAPAATLPNDLRVSLLTSVDQLVSASVARIRFSPDGSSSGGRVSVEGGNRTWWVGIDWLSGRVSIVEQPRT